MKWKKETTVNQKVTSQQVEKLLTGISSAHEVDRISELFGGTDAP